MKNYLLLLLVLTLSSCTTYRWVDITDCPEELGDYKKCRQVVN